MFTGTSNQRYTFGAMRAIPLSRHACRQVPVDDTVVADRDDRAAADFRICLHKCAKRLFIYDAHIQLNYIRDKPTNLYPAALRRTMLFVLRQYEIGFRLLACVKWPLSADLSEVVLTLGQYMLMLAGVFDVVESTTHEQIVKAMRGIVECAANAKFRNIESKREAYVMSLATTDRLSQLVRTLFNAFVLAVEQFMNIVQAHLDNPDAIVRLLPPLRSLCTQFCGTSSSGHGETTVVTHNTCSLEQERLLACVCAASLPDYAAGLNDSTSEWNTLLTTLLFPALAKLAADKLIDADARQQVQSSWLWFAVPYARLAYIVNHLRAQVRRDCEKYC